MIFFPTSRRRSERGFTILLAALVTSLVLSVGISVYSIAIKEIYLSSLGRSSQYAFYAADTAAECALYWDFRSDAFDPTGLNPGRPISPITCDGNAAIVVTHLPESLPSYPVVFQFRFQPNGYCTDVYVTKNTVHPKTRIHADGFSVDCASISTNPRALQRSVELSY